MRYFQRTLPHSGGTKQICVAVDDKVGLVGAKLDDYHAVASFPVGPLQRHLLACVREGFLSAGDTLYDLDRKRFLVGDVGQLSQEGSD